MKTLYVIPKVIFIFVIVLCFGCSSTEYIQSEHKPIYEPVKKKLPTICHEAKKLKKYRDSYFEVANAPISKEQSSVDGNFMGSLFDTAQLLISGPPQGNYGTPIGTILKNQKEEEFRYRKEQEEIARRIAEKNYQEKKADREIAFKRYLIFDKLFNQKLEACREYIYRKKTQKRIKSGIKSEVQQAVIGI